VKTPSGTGQQGFERCGFLMGRLGKVVARRFTKALEATGLKPPHAAVLMTLRDRGPMTQQALGDQLHVDPSNLVGLLNELEDNSWAVRRRDPDDRRRHIVEISGDGMERVADLDKIVTGVEDQLLAGLDEREREQLQGLLARVLEQAAGEERVEIASGDYATAQASTGAGAS
jgi:DNA-binding MarR family transcriptional regulator